MTQMIPSEVVEKLRGILVNAKDSDLYRLIIEPKEAVLDRYGPIFNLEHAKKITEEEIRSFLQFQNNHHWTGLHRLGPRLSHDMNKLREAIYTLVDEAQPVEKRLNEAIEMADGLGKNIATAILLISQPEKYGVWNNRSELIMKQLGIWPNFNRGESFGARYLKVNTILLNVCEILKTDLWTLDAIWWRMDIKDDDSGETSVEGDGNDVEKNHLDQSFGLERHLHEFLRDNWSRTELGKEWEIYQEPGDDEVGYEYPCEVGRIDILAKHKKEPKWLVVELKRNQTSDQTVGQVLRYTGWVKKNLAEDNDDVCGMIICRKSDKSLEYALSTLSNIELRLYQVQFQLKQMTE